LGVRVTPIRVQKRYVAFGEIVIYEIRVEYDQGQHLDLTTGCMDLGYGADVTHHFTTQDITDR
jgi:hypothetical protein